MKWVQDKCRTPEGPFIDSGPVMSWCRDYLSRPLCDKRLRRRQSETDRTNKMCVATRNFWHYAVSQVSQMRIQPALFPWRFAIRNIAILVSDYIFIGNIGYSCRAVKLLPFFTLNNHSNFFWPFWVCPKWNLHFNNPDLFFLSTKWHS